MRNFYHLEGEYDSKFWANVEEGHEFDFLEEKIYDIPLEYPYKFKMVNGTFLDYTPTDTYNIFSEKLKNIIDKFEKNIEWIHLKVEDQDGSIKDAYLPRYIPKQHMFDVLNKEHSIIDAYGIIMPALSEKKLSDRHFIRLLENQHMNYVSEDLKKAMQKAKVTGVKFSKRKLFS